jgi:hypothetical protein
MQDHPNGYFVFPVAVDEQERGALGLHVRCQSYEEAIEIINRL